MRHRVADECANTEERYRVLHAYQLMHSRPVLLLEATAAVGLLALALIETSPANIVVDARWHAALELLLLAIAAALLAGRCWWQGVREVCYHRLSIIKAVALAVLTIEAIVVMARGAVHVRVLRFLRPVFLLDSYYAMSCRRFVRQLMQSLPRIVDVLVILFTVMLLFALLG